MPDERIPNGPEIEPDFDPEKGPGVADDADERLQKSIGKLEKELDAAFGDRLQKAEALAENLKVRSNSHLGAEMESKLQSIESRASEARGRNEKVGTVPKREQRGADDMRGLGFGMQVAYTIIGLPLAGAAIGWLVDRSTGAHFWVGICVLIGAALGVFAAIVLLNKENQRR